MSRKPTPPDRKPEHTYTVDKALKLSDFDDFVDGLEFLAHRLKQSVPEGKTYRSELERLLCVLRDTEIFSRMLTNMLIQYCGKDQKMPEREIAYMLDMSHVTINRMRRAPVSHEEFEAFLHGFGKLPKGSYKDTFSR